MLKGFCLIPNTFLSSEEEPTDKNSETPIKVPERGKKSVPSPQDEATDEETETEWKPENLSYVELKSVVRLVTHGCM